MHKNGVLNRHAANQHIAYKALYLLIGESEWLRLCT